MSRSQSLSSWLLSKSLAVVGFGMVKESLFEMWLSARLETSDFFALELWRVLEASENELGLERDEGIGLLIRLTRSGAAFKSDGGLITFRG